MQKDSKLNKSSKNGQGLLPIVKELVNEGLTQREIAKKLGFESQKSAKLSKKSQPTKKSDFILHRG